MKYAIHTGSNLDVLPTLPDSSIDAIVTDPPYELGFMGKSWDSTGIAYNVALWRECLRVLKPGGHILAFSGSRTYHRMTVAIEDAGFEIRDQMLWVYGSGFPKSHNISKAIDKAAGQERETVGFKSAGIGTGKSYGKIVGEREKVKTNLVAVTAPASEAAKQWGGWGTALKPAHEPICLARKPIEGTVADNVLKWGVGGLNIEGCRVGEGTGRFPANLMHDGSQEVLDLFPQSKSTGGVGCGKLGSKVYGNFNNQTIAANAGGLGDEGSAARFFYCPKTGKKDRDEGCGDLEDKEWKTDGACIPERGDRPFNPSKNNHPTVKPTELMRYLCRLITPPGGTVLDPFNGSGSTGKAAVLEGFNYVGIELSPEYVQIAKARIKAVLKSK
jgi:site-specific DNA-methyltransferase (adenine-specific)